jgi:hypothetical protein
MPLDPPARPVGEFVLGQGCEEAGGRPALAVGGFGEAWPDPGDGRQSQFA